MLKNFKVSPVSQKLVESKLLHPAFIENKNKFSEEDSAELFLLQQFLGKIAAKQYKEALNLSTDILKLDPKNEVVKEYLILLTKINEEGLLEDEEDEEEEEEDGEEGLSEEDGDDNEENDVSSDSNSSSDEDESETASENEN
ncbi:hypothetical protein HK099_003386 [Clydaea vesicula]|uniref:Uncharacterized protein n=1 Tax=Clydaea vesicula TaxID=447962 RepID=A0AAD5XWC7_9FUNG|nr:hypothetical protein HK099_003386 [Clydaea vesicula]